MDYKRIWPYATLTEVVMPLVLKCVSVYVDLGDPLQSGERPLRGYRLLSDKAHLLGKHAVEYVVDAEVRGSPHLKYAGLFVTTNPGYITYCQVFNEDRGRGIKKLLLVCEPVGTTFSMAGRIEHPDRFSRRPGEPPIPFCDVGADSFICSGLKVVGYIQESASNWDSDRIKGMAKAIRESKLQQMTINDFQSVLKGNDGAQ